MRKLDNFVRHDGQPRVVITGMAVVSPLGSQIDLFWNRLRNGQSGIKRVPGLQDSNLQAQVAGLVAEFDPLQFMSPKDARKLERANQFAIAAAQLAMQDAGFTQESLFPHSERIGTIVGTAFAGYDALRRAIGHFEAGKRPSPAALVSSLTNMPTFYVAQTIGAAGFNSTVTTACAAGTQAVGAGSELIRRGRADLVFAGGVEALVTDYILAAFDSMTSLARGYFDNPTAASRPFSADRSGFVLSEGAAMLVLERLDAAQARAARIYAEVAGYATSNDIYHITAIDPEGKGAKRCMQWAADDAGVDATDIDYINAHGTGTRMNDPIETTAIKHVVGDDVLVSSTKSMLGHLLGASGAIEAVATSLALHHQCVPPTINLDISDPECDLDYVPHVARNATLNIAMSNSFGLGGHNASLILRRV